jgi:hypothetical protein
MNADSILRSSRVPLRLEPRRGLLWRVVRWVHRLWWLIFRWFHRWRRLAFTMQHQQQTQWCWAAVSTSVSLYYDTSSTWTQCTVVNAELNQTTCCQNGATAACNQPWYLDRALQRTGNLDGFSGGTTAFADVRTEIDAGRPLGTRVGWSGGGGHFAVIEGYKPGPTEQRVAIDDPWYGASDLTYNTFATSYQGTGSWTHSYTTES